MSDSPSTSATDERVWLTLREAAARARLHPATLRLAVKAGRLRAARVNAAKAFRFRAIWIDQWLEASPAQPVEDVR